MSLNKCTGCVRDSKKHSKHSRVYKKASTTGLYSYSKSDEHEMSCVRNKALQGILLWENNEGQSGVMCPSFVQQ